MSVLEDIGARVIKRMYTLPLLGRWMMREREELVRAGEELQKREQLTRVERAMSVAKSTERRRCLDVLTHEYKTRREAGDNPRATTVLARLYQEVQRG